MSKNKCGLFRELYDTNPGKPFKSCFNEQIGKEYICPRVGLGVIETQSLNPWFAAQQCNRNNLYPGYCYNDGAIKVSQNMGVSPICNRPFSSLYVTPDMPLYQVNNQWQQGGADDSAAITGNLGGSGSAGGNIGNDGSSGNSGNSGSSGSAGGNIGNDGTSGSSGNIGNAGGNIGNAGGNIGNAGGNIGNSGGNIGNSGSSGSSGSGNIGNFGKCWKFWKFWKFWKC